MKNYYESTAKNVLKHSILFNTFFSNFLKANFIKIIFFLLITINLVNGQSTPKLIDINKSLQKVPFGKKWVINRTDIFRVKVNNDVYDPSTFDGNCFNKTIHSLLTLNVIRRRGKSTFSSSQEYLSLVNSPEMWTINFERFEKREKNIEIIPSSFTNLADYLQYRGKVYNNYPTSPPNELTFYSHEMVYVWGGIESIEIYEVDLNEKELLEEKKYIETNNIQVNTIISSENSKDIVVKPEFPSGMQRLYNFLSENLRNTGDNGKEFIKFQVDENGLIGDIELLKPVSPSMDAEVIRVIALMPRWKPGTINGKKVKMPVYLPISFKN